MTDLRILAGLTVVVVHVLMAFVFFRFETRNPIVL